MAVVNVKEKWSTPTGDAQWDKKGGGTHAASRTFTVLVDDLTDTVLTAQGATGIPRGRDPHPSDFTLRVSSIRARAISQLLYEVEVGYDSPTKGDNKDSPLNEPAKIKIFGIDSTEKIDEDIYGSPIVTPTGERFEPQEMDWRDLAISIERNVLDPGLVQLRTYQNVVNSDDFLGYPPGTAKMARFEADNVIDGDFQYWRRSAEIHFRVGMRTTDERAWWLRIRCEGYYAFFDLDDLGFIVARVTDEFGEPTSQPALLYANPSPSGHDPGTKIPVVKPGDLTSVGQYAEWQEFQIYRTAPFNALNLL